MTFVRRDPSLRETAFNVAVTFDKKKLHEGQVGIEVEVEGNKFPKPSGHEGTHTPVAMPGMKGWSYVHDGSLRGKDNAEYILTQPVAFEQVPLLLDILYDGLAKYGSVIDSSQRTSVHIHLNVESFFLNRLTSLMALYLCFEEVLTAWCGEQRVGNLFCLRAKDAPAIVSQLRRFIQSDMGTVMKEHHRYAGMNACSVSNLGSLEFRALRGVPDPSAIVDWVGILRRLYDLSQDFSDPRDICGHFSAMGPMQFFNHILGDRAGVVREGIEYSDDEIATSMYEGIRIAQDICYCRDWDVFKGIEFSPDPFGRSNKSVLKRLKGAANSEDAPLPPSPTGIQQFIAAHHSQAVPALDPLEMIFDPEFD